MTNDITIRRIFVLAFEESFRLVRQMPGAVLTSSPLAVAAPWVARLVTGQFHTLVGELLGGTLVFVASFWLSAPYGVAFYRFILLNETIKPELLRGSREAETFFAWCALFSLAFAIMTIVATLAGGGPPSLSVMLTMTFVSFIWVLRSITVLPAAALGRPASLKAALMEGRGHFWFSLGAILLPVCALFAAYTILGTLIRVSGVLPASLGPNAAYEGLSLLVGPVVNLTLISVTARLYQRFVSTATEPT